MTEMARKTISLTPELEQAVYELRKTDEFCKCSYSEIIREMIRRGIQAGRQSQQGKAGWG